MWRLPLAVVGLTILAWALGSIGKTVSDWDLALFIGAVTLELAVVSLFWLLVSRLLTPHAGELARLLSDLGEDVHREDIEAQPYRHTHTAARLTGATVLLKGATTLVVRPDGHARSQAEAPSWLATAGAGDVLAGIAGALLASGLSPFDAGSVAAYVHGKAAGRASGGGPITSMDVAENISPTVGALLRH